jgi:hypothetical protein
MDEVAAVERPPMWQSFLVGLFLFGLILGPATGMVFYFYAPIAVKIGGYIGNALLVGVGTGFLLSAVIAAVFAKKASG